MRKFSVNVNGTKYEVEVEELDANAVAQAPKATEPVKSAPAGAGTEVRSPMPGNILQVNVNPGDTVKVPRCFCGTPARACSCARSARIRRRRTRRAST